MSVTLPRIVTGVINGEEDAWSRACSLLGAYYQPEGGRRSAFDLIVSGDPYADDTLFSGTDLAALTCLGVSLDERAADMLLRDETFLQLSRDLPVLTDLVDADDELLDGDSASGQMWEYLTSRAGLSWKQAEAVLARLRPALFPVVTATERKALGASKEMPQLWIELRELLRHDDARLAYQLYYLVQTAPVWSELSQLQVLMALIYTDAQEAKALKRERKREKQARKLAAARARELAGASAPEPTLETEASAISTDAFRLR